MRTRIDADGIVANFWHVLAIEHGDMEATIAGGFTEEGDRILCLRTRSDVLVGNIDTRQAEITATDSMPAIETVLSLGLSALNGSSRPASFGFFCERLRAQ